MHVVADLSVVPVGTDPSVSHYVKTCRQIIEQAGLCHRVHAHGTNVEGEWETVMQAMKQCHQTLHEMGAPRLSSTLKLGTRTDKPEQSLTEKVEQVGGDASG